MPRKLCVSISVTGLAHSTRSEPITLEGLLSSPSQPRQVDTGKLSGQQRLSIAVDLAHGVLQLYQTPWLCDSWSMKDVYFFSHGVDNLKRPKIDWPFVTRTFGQNDHRSESKQPPDEPLINDIARCLIINKTLFALGIVLIELCFKKPFNQLCAEIESLDGPASEGTPDVLKTYRVATDLIEAVYNEQGMEYGYVVQRCLRCEFGVQDSLKRFEFEAFRAKVYEGVVAPLEQDLKRYPVPLS